MEIQHKFKEIEAQISIFKPVMARTAEVVFAQDVSNYPIFVAHPTLLEINIGIPIAQKEAAESKWAINISTLEEFVARQLIDNEKIDNFRTLYKAHRNEFCLFVLSDMGATFIFLPH